MMTSGRIFDRAWPFAWLAPFATFLLALGVAPLFDVDEGAFSEATREMFERGDFLFTYLNGEPRFDKPILVYWLQALGYLLFGPSEWAFRLPSALCGIGWSLAVWQFVRTRVDETSARLAMVVTATALGPFAIGRAATADALLNLLLVLTLFDAWRHLESGCRAALWRSFVWMALGALTKGPIALLVPAAVTFLYCATTGRWRDWLRSAFFWRGWVLFAALVLPWYAWALYVHGQDFIDGFFLRHNVERFTATLEGHAGSLFYYVLVVPLLALPWTAPLLSSLGRLREGWASPLTRFLWLWAGFVIAFFSLSGTKLPHYALYGATPLFILVALGHARWQRALPHLLPALLLPLIALLLPGVFWLLAQGDAGDAYYRAQLAQAFALMPWWYLPLTALALAAGVWLLRCAALAVWQRLAALALLQALVLALAFVPYAGEVVQGSVRAAGRVAHDLGGDAVTWRFTAPSFSVYRQAVSPRRDPAPGELALVRVDRLPPPEAGFETVFAQGGVRLLRAPTERVPDAAVEDSPPLGDVSTPDKAALPAADAASSPSGGTAAVPAAEGMTPAAGH